MIWQTDGKSDAGFEVTPNQESIPPLVPIVLDSNLSYAEAVSQHEDKPLPMEFYAFA